MISPHPRCLWILPTKLLYFGSATAHSHVTVAVASCTIFLGCSLEFSAFSFINSKTLSCSKCLISGSCKFSRIVKMLFWNVVAITLHYLLSHFHPFLIQHFHVTGITESVRGSPWAFPADFWQILKAWLIQVTLVGQIDKTAGYQRQILRLPIFVQQVFKKVKTFFYRKNTLSSSYLLIFPTFKVF